MTVFSTVSAKFGLIASMVFVAACEPVDTTNPADSPATAPATAPQTPPDPVSTSQLASEAINIANYFDGFAGQNLGGNLRITGATADGSTVNVVSRVTSTRVRFEASSLRQQLRGFICSQDGLRSFVEQGGDINFDVTGRNTSHSLGSVTISSC